MKRFVALCLAIVMPILGLAMLVHNIKAAPRLTNGVFPEAPDANSLSLAAAWQATASAETTFGLTFTIGNSSVYTFNNLLLTATVPSNATHIGGGNLVGDEVHFELAQLAPGCCTEVSFYFSASQPIGTSSYQLTAQNDSGGLTAVTDVLEENWNNWSWDTNASMSSSQSHAGSNSLAVRHTGGFGGLFLHGGSGINTDDLVAVRFWVHGGNSGGQNLGLKLERPDGSFTNEQIIVPTANTWTEFTFPLSAFGVVTDVHGIVIQSRQQGAQPIYYLDEVALLPHTGAQGVATTNILLPGLQINKSGPATAAMGAPVVYSVAVGNPGPGTATDLVITDVVPAGATYISGGTLNGNIVSWTIPSLAEGVTSTVQFTVSATQTITNSDYAVTAAGGFSATGSIPVTTLITPPQLSISKRGPESVVVGNPIIYALRVANNGTTPASNIVVTDTLPANTSYVSGGALNGNVVTWVAPTLAAGQVVTLTLRVLPDEPTSFPATVVNHDYAVRADGGYSAVGQNAVSTRVLGSQLSLSKQAPATVDLGELLTYTLVITNSGDLTATNIILTDELPDGAVYQNGGNFNGTTVSFAIPLISPNTTVIRQFSILPDEDEAPFLGTLQNHTYGLTSGQGAIITGTETVSTTVHFPDLSINKTGPDEVTAGDPIVYELSVSNHGAMAATNLFITDTLPSGATFVGASNAGSLVGGEVRWQLTSLGPGVTTTLLFTVTAEATVINSDYGVTADFNRSATGDNVVATTVGPAGFVIYIPIIANKSDGSEPNDSCSQAYEIERNQTYNFLPDDTNDFYVFDLPSSANLNIFLTNFFPVNGQIVLYRAPSCGNLQFIANNGDFSTTKTIHAGVQPAGRYLILVINDGATSSSQLYSLRVSSP